jgi:predicted ATP-grasp superfamily ATP-dependent carboligase
MLWKNRSRGRAAEQPRAVVVGLESFVGLQTARILSQRGVPVIATTGNPDSGFCKTNSCEEILTTGPDGVGLSEALEALGPRLSQKAVLFPCTDMSVLRVSRARERLAEWYHVALPPAGVVEMLTDKVRFYTYAQEAGLPIPKTHFLRSHHDAERVAAEASFPCVLKPPMNTPRWEQSTGAKVHRVADPAELLALYDRASKLAEILIVQEWIEGADADLFSCNCYFDADTQPVVTFVARKLRQWPPEAGVSCLGEECRNSVVLRESIQLFQNLGHRGLGYVEMKRDRRTGKHYIIEPNVGRPTGRSAIAEAGGVELLYATYCDTIGQPLPAGLEQRYVGAKWVYLLRDLQTSLYYWRLGELSLLDWWRSLRGRKRFAVFSSQEPRPFMAQAFALFGSVLRPIVGRAGARLSAALPSAPPRRRPRPPLRKAEL